VKFSLNFLLEPWNLFSAKVVHGFPMERWLLALDRVYFFFEPFSHSLLEGTGMQIAPFPHPARPHEKDKLSLLAKNFPLEQLYDNSHNDGN
jgi:hypothetical protein